MSGPQFDVHQTLKRIFQDMPQTPKSRPVTVLTKSPPNLSKENRYFSSPKKQSAYEIVTPVPLRSPSRRTTIDETLTTPHASTIIASDLNVMCHQVPGTNNIECDVDVKSDPIIQKLEQKKIELQEELPIIHQAVEAKKEEVEEIKKDIEDLEQAKHETAQKIQKSINAYEATTAAVESDLHEKLEVALEQKVEKLIKSEQVMEQLLEKAEQHELQQLRVDEAQLAQEQKLESKIRSATHTRQSPTTFIESKTRASIPETVLINKKMYNANEMIEYLLSQHMPKKIPHTGQIMNRVQCAQLIHCIEERHPSIIVNCEKNIVCPESCEKPRYVKDRAYYINAFMKYAELLASALKNPEYYQPYIYYCLCRYINHVQSSVHPHITGKDIDAIYILKQEECKGLFRGACSFEKAKNILVSKLMMSPQEAHIYAEAWASKIKYRVNFSIDQCNWDRYFEPWMCKGEFYERLRHVDPNVLCHIANSIPIDGSNCEHVDPHCYDRFKGEEIQVGYLKPPPLPFAVGELKVSGPNSYKFFDRLLKSLNLGWVQ